jgi:TPR repeat protein
MRGLGLALASLVLFGYSAFADDTSTVAAIAACDKAAGAPNDKELTPGIQGVAPDKIEAVEAIRACKAAADASPDNGRIQMQLGRAYAAAKSYDEARVQYERATKSGNGAAANNLAKIHSDGLGTTKKDDREAARLFRVAADRGHAIAQSNLANFYQNGRGGLPKDEAEAVRLHKLAADQGLASSQNHLAIAYRKGRGGLPKDDREAARYFKLAADQGLAAAQAYLGYLYQGGLGGLPKDDAAALRLYRAAAEQGDSTARFNLGVLYAAGRGGVAKDEQEAARLYKLAADRGHGSAQHNLGIFYQHGLGGLPKDEAAALLLYQSAAKLGIVPAQFGLGLYYLTGRGGLPKDEQEGIRLYKKAADQGDANAQTNLAKLYEDGSYGLSKDEVEAARLYRLAANQGNRYALNNLGNYYEYGRGGLAKDENEAVRLYRLAVEKGSTGSQYALDRLFKKNPELAKLAPATISRSPGTTDDSNSVPKIEVAPPERRVALVIGNSAYRSVPVLPNPARDAASVAQALRRVGFQSVTLVNDVTREKAAEALREFAKEADKSDWALIYYAGHGIEVGGMNYLIPVDAKLASDRDVQLETIGLEQAMSAAEGAKKLRLILLDACRDNPFAHQIKRSVALRSMGRGLAQIEPDSGMLVVYAAKHGQVALDGDGANSPFATALVKRIATPRIEVRKLFDLVRDDVMSATRRQQQPFSYGSVPGAEDFFFTTKAASAR